MVLFWDIDGTLLSTARAGIYAWEDALREILGVEVSLDSFPTAGDTDVEIARQLAALHGGGDEHTLPLLRHYEDRLPASLRRKTGRVMPNVREILQYARDCDGIDSMLLTGNTRRGAVAKLTHYGLVDLVDQGGCADDGERRADIAAHALRLACGRRGAVALDGVYVIGDTPKDIACGKAIGARTIAVATGIHELAELQKHDPWWAIEELPALRDFLAKVEG